LKEQIPPAALRKGSARAYTAVIGLQSASRFGFMNNRLAWLDCVNWWRVCLDVWGRPSLHHLGLAED